MLAKLTGLDIARCTGAGTGLDAQAVQRKTAVLREVLVQHLGVQALLVQFTSNYPRGIAPVAHSWAWQALLPECLLLQ